MATTQDYMGRKVFRLKRASRKARAEGQEFKLAKLGRIRQALYSPDGTRVVGFIVKRPDVVGMVKRQDAFVAVDSLAREGKGLVVTREDGGMGGQLWHGGLWRGGISPPRRSDHAVHGS